MLWSWLQSLVHHRAKGEVATHSCEGEHLIEADPGIPDGEGQIHAVQDDEEQEGGYQDQHDQGPDIGSKPGALGIGLPPGSDLMLQLMALAIIISSCSLSSGLS